MTTDDDTTRTALADRIERGVLYLTGDGPLLESEHCQIVSALREDGHLRPYVEAFRREEARADKAEREIDDLRANRAASDREKPLPAVKTDDELRIILIFAQGCSNWTGEMTGEICRCEDGCGCLDVVRTLRSEIEGHNILERPAPCSPDSNWQPIDTAPKDMRPILVFVPGLRTGSLQEEPDQIHVAFLKRADTYALQDADHFIVTPTHWMPLPALPSGLRGDDCTNK